MTILTECIEKLSSKYELDECIRLVAKLPRELADEPYANVLWDINTQTIIPRGRVLVRNLMLYMLREVKSSETLLRRYAAALDKEIEDVQLPKPV